MTKEQLQEIIARFDEEELKRQAVFGIAQYGGGADESFIRANKEGFELFALELLKSARDTESVLADPRKTIIPFNYEENWIDGNSDTFIQYVEPIADKQKLQPRAERKSTFAERLVPYGCGLIVIIFVVSAIIGLLTLFKLLF